jgi:hypothetical protein
MLPLSSFPVIKKVGEIIDLACVPKRKEKFIILK